MPDKHYYVSAQNGNNTNDGLSPATAWKTLTKAAQSISPATDGYTYIHIGPGVYRERFISPSGPSATAKVIWAGDPYCQYLIYDKPGRVRITGCNAQEYPTVGRVLDWTGRTNVELWGVEVDGCKNDYAVYNVEICRRVNVTGYYCFYFGVANSAAYDCTAVGWYGFYSNASNVTLHRCVAAAYYPFQGTSSYTLYVYNCIAIGGQYAFSYCNAYWSIAITPQQAGSYSSLCGCILIGGSHSGGARNLFLGSSSNGTGNYAAYSPNVPSISGTVDCNEAPHFALDYGALRQLVRFLDVFGIINPYLIHHANESTSYTMNLSTERIYAFTPPQAGVSYGASIFVYSLASSGYVTVELQKYVGNTWVTQASKALPVSALVAGRWNNFFWDTITGDVNLTTASNTWRFRITADANAVTTTIYGSSTAPSIRGWYIPTSLVPLLAQDVNGLTRQDNVFQAGAVVAPNISLDYATYYASYPSIKIVGAGERALELPAKGGEPITVSYYVLHTGAASGKEPQLKVSGPGITQQVATHSAGANVWQKLEASVTPPTDMLLTVILSSRDKDATVYFSDPYVS